MEPSDPRDGSGRYEIRLAGHLAPRWASRFAGMALTIVDDGTTTLDGHVVDQAALHGLLRTLRDTGLPLISVTRISPGDPGPPQPHRPVRTDPAPPTSRSRS